MSMLRTPVTSADHIQGPMDAPVTLVEYGDYECGYCGLAFPNIKRAQKHFAKKLRFVFRHFPLTEAHPFAEAAARLPNTPERMTSSGRCTMGFMQIRTSSA